MVGGCFSESSPSLAPFWDENLRDLSLQPLSLLDRESFHAQAPETKASKLTNTHH